MINKYKTAMCKHFEQTGQCHMGNRCHFAHGPEELRQANEAAQSNVTQVTTIPRQQPSVFNNQAGGNHFKTAKCKYFDKGQCKFGNSCSFAHGEVDLRSTNSHPSPQGSGTNGMNAPLSDNAIKNMIAQKQIENLAQHMEAYHGNEPELLNKIKQAIELNNSGNSQDSADILYKIMSRPDKTKENHENYGIFTYNMQNLGDTLYQQYQMQQYTQTGGMQQQQQQRTAPTMNTNTQRGGNYNDFNRPNNFKQQQQFQQGFGNQGYQKNYNNNFQEGQFNSNSYTGSFGYNGDSLGNA